MTEHGGIPPAPPLPTEPPAHADLSQGPVSTFEQAQAADYLIAQKHRRWMRWLAFGGLGFACMAFLMGLLQVLYGMLMDHSFPLLVPDGGTVADTRAAALIGLALVIFAAIPLSLALTILKLSADPASAKNSTDDVAFAVTTPQFEFLKSLYALLKRSP